jgi:hypothetical protein
MMSDPRTFPAAASASPGDQAIYRLAEAGLGAETGLLADALGRELRQALARQLRGDGDALAATFAGAPSVAVGRLLWRLLDAEWRDATLRGASGVAVTLFAIPLVVVVGSEQRTDSGAIPGVLADCAALAAILMEHGGLAGNRSVAVADVLVGADAVDLARLPALLEWQRLLNIATDARSRAQLVPAPRVSPTASVLHVFLVGAIANPASICWPRPAWAWNRVDAGAGTTTGPQPPFGAGPAA